MDLEGWRPDVIIETDALKEQRALSFQAENRILYQLLETADYDFPVINRPDGSVFIPTRDLTVAFERDERMITAVGTLMSKIGYTKDRPTCGGRQRAGYWLPPLPEARRMFADHMGGEDAINWSDECEWPEQTYEF